MRSRGDFIAYLGGLIPSHDSSGIQVLNKIIKDEIYRRFIHITWVTSPGGLCPKMAFYVENFLKLRDGLIARPHFTFCHWVPALCIPLN
jgi:hypothetical protein